MRRPMPQTASGGLSPSSSNQVSPVRRYTPAGLPKSVATLACSLFFPMPTLHSSARGLHDLSLHVPRIRLGVVGDHPEEGLVPAENLDHRASAAQHSPSPPRTPPRTRPCRRRGTRRRGCGAPPSAMASRTGRRTRAPRRTPCSRRRASSGRRHRRRRRAGRAARGRRRTSTAAMNWSRSTCSTQRPTPAVCPQGASRPALGSQASTTTTTPHNSAATPRARLGMAPIASG